MFFTSSNLQRKVRGRAGLVGVWVGGVTPNLGKKFDQSYPFDLCHRKPRFSPTLRDNHLP